MKKNNKRTHGRVREEPTENYGGQANKKRPTFNVQRPTSKVQRRDVDPARPTEQRYDLEDRLLDYAVRIIRLVDALPRTQAGRHVADQLLRCGTSPLANHGELQGAESRKDFIHKLGICLKEIREARRWLRLVHRVPLLTPSKVEQLIFDRVSLAKISFASIRTTEKNRR